MDDVVDTDVMLCNICNNRWSIDEVEFFLISFHYYQHKLLPGVNPYCNLDQIVSYQVWFLFLDQMAVVLAKTVQFETEEPLSNK